MTEKAPLMFFSGWLKVSSNPPPPYNIRNSMDSLSSNAQITKKKPILFCQVLNQYFTIATNECFSKILLHIPLADISSIIEPTIQHPTKFSIEINIEDEIENPINNPNNANENSNHISLKECNTKINNNNNSNPRINAFISHDMHNTKMAFHFKSHCATRAKKWIVSLTQRQPISNDEAHSELKKMTNQMMSINDFIIKKKIGCGCSGNVLLAQNKQTLQHYALKSIPKNNIMKSSRLMRAMAERNILMSASHPFITKLISTFQTKDHLFLVLEFVPGGNLAYHLNRNVMFDQEIICLYLAEIATALSYLHNMGIVFRDLKPENILISEDGHLKLTDFGHAKYLMNHNYYKSLSKVAQSNQENINSMKFNSMRRSGSLCGTYEFLAPEMIDQKGYNFAIDWWAFGILAYRLICGTLPFKNLNLERLFQMITDAPLKFYDQISPDECNFIERLLEKDPHKRLGCNSEIGEKEIFEHPYFKNINWDMVNKKQYTPSFIPESTEFNLVANFDPKITRQMPCNFEEIENDAHKVQFAEDENESNGNMYVKDFSFSTINSLAPQIPIDS